MSSLELKLHLCGASISEGNRVAVEFAPAIANISHPGEESPTSAVRRRAASPERESANAQLPPLLPGKLSTRWPLAPKRDLEIFFFFLIYQSDRNYIIYGSEAVLRFCQIAGHTQRSKRDNIFPHVGLTSRRWRWGRG